MFVEKNKMDTLISSLNSNEWFNSISHFIGAVLSIVGAIVLVALASFEQKWLHAVGFSIYGLTLFSSMFASTLLHFNLAFNKYYRVLGKLDHAAIYLLIAGSSTPFMLAVLEPTQGWVSFGIIWSLAILFLILKLVFFVSMPKLVSTGSYLLLSWLGVVIFYQIYLRLGVAPFFIILGGGIAYTGGAIVFTYGRLDLFPPYFGTHEIWHMAVLVGNASIFIVHLFYTLPFLR